MTDLSGKNFNIESLRESGIETLRITVDSDTKVNHYQIEILKVNDTLNFMPIKHNKGPKGYDFFYNLNSKLSFSNLIESMELSKEDVFKFFVATVKHVVSCYKYLLTDVCVVLDVDYIFIDINTKGVYIIYIPIDNSGDVVGELRKFFIKTINRMIETKNYNNHKYLNEILVLVDKGLYDVKDLYRNLKKIRDKNINITKSDIGSLNNTDINKNGYVNNNTNFNSIDEKPNRKEGKLDYNDFLINSFTNGGQFTTNPNEISNKSASEQQSSFNIKDDLENVNLDQNKDLGYERKSDELEVPEYEDNEDILNEDGLLNSMSVTQNFSINFEDFSDATIGSTISGKKGKKMVKMKNELINDKFETPKQNDFNANRGTKNKKDSEVYSEDNINKESYVQKGGSKPIFLAVILQLIIIGIVGGLIWSDYIASIVPGAQEKKTTYLFIIATAVVVSAMIWEKVADKKIMEKKNKDKDNYPDNKKYNDYDDKKHKEFDDYSDETLNRRKKPRKQPGLKRTDINKKAELNMTKDDELNKTKDYDFNDFLGNNVISSFPESRPSYPKSDTANTIPPIKQPEQPRKPSKPVWEEQGEEATVVMFDENFPFLEDITGETNDKVMINKNSFLIGRLKAQSDYVAQSNTVGRVHAEIITRSGTYYVKDLKSRNGTFLNGMRLDSDKEYMIKSNDRLSFANTHFRFVIP